MSLAPPLPATPVNPGRVMLIHGQADRRFPLQFALDLKAAFDPQQVEIYVAPSAGHSDSSLTPGYGPAVRAFLQRRLETG